jgi:hypothetical protein
MKEYRVLPQCPALSELDLQGNRIGDQGAGLAGVPPQCPALSYLNLSSNEIGAEAADRLRAVWSGEPIHLVL